ncbi:MAG TPA: ATPase, partial [Casimicrobiaceae bacterium]
TQAYIEHRLRHVGWNGDPRFDPAAFDLIHSWSAGIPRQINTLCNRLLLAGFLGEKHAFGLADVQAIAREIHEELGPEAKLAAVPRSVEPVAPLPIGRDVGSAAVLDELREIERRITRLETAVSTVIGLMNRLLQRDRPVKPGAPASR